VGGNGVATSHRAIVSKDYWPGLRTVLPRHLGAHRRRLPGPRISGYWRCRPGLHRAPAARSASGPCSRASIGETPPSAKRWRKSCC